MKENFYYIDAGLDVYYNLRYVDLVSKTNCDVIDRYNNEYVLSHTYAPDLYDNMDLDPNFILLDGVYMNKREILSVWKHDDIISVGFGRHNIYKHHISLHGPDRMKNEEYIEIANKLADTHCVVDDTLWNKNVITEIYKEKKHYEAYKAYDALNQLHLNKLPDGFTRINGRFYNLPAISLIVDRGFTIYAYTHFGINILAYDHKVKMREALQENGFLLTKGYKLDKDYYVRKDDIVEYYDYDANTDGVDAGAILDWPERQFVCEEGAEITDQFIQLTSGFVNIKSIVYIAIPRDGRRTHIYIGYSGAYWCGMDKINQILNKINIINKS